MLNTEAESDRFPQVIFYYGFFETMTFLLLCCENKLIMSLSRDKNDHILKITS